MIDTVPEEEFSLKKLFIPLTTIKAFHFILIIGLLVYFNALFGKFVWDDVTYIILNPELHSVNILKLFGENTFNSSGYYRPIPALYFAIVYSLFGVQYFFYHFFQISLHIINTCLLFLLLKQFIKKELSFFLALLFLVHPIQVESVSYIGASQSELFFCFGIGALLMAIKERLKIRDYLVISGLLLCSILTKETGFLFFVIITLYRILFYRKSILTIFPYFGGVLAVYFLIRFGLAGIFFTKITVIPIAQLSLAERILNIPAITAYYIKTLFFPMEMAIDQLWTITTITFSSFYLPLIICSVFFLALILLGVITRKENSSNSKLYLFFCAWFVLSLSLHLQLFPLDMTVADRWFYLPFAGLLGAIGIALDQVPLKRQRVRYGAVIACLSVISLLSVRTIIRNADWRDPITLYSHDIRIENNYQLANFLGAELAYAGRYKDALPYISQAVRQNPRDNNIYNLGVIYENLQDDEKAEYYYRKVLSHMTVRGEKNEVRKNAYLGLSRLKVLQGNPARLKPFLTQAVSEYPDNGTLWSYLAITEYKLNNYHEALTAAEKSVTYLPNPSTKKLYNIIKQQKPLNVVDK